MTNSFSKHSVLSAYDIEYILYKASCSYWYLTKIEANSIKLGMSKLKAGHINKVLKNMELLQFVCTFDKYNELPTKYPELFV